MPRNRAGVRRRRFVALLFLPALVDDAAAAEGDDLPPDVRSYLERRSACEHFLGEEPYDAERRRFLRLRILQTCAGINEQARATRELHRDDPEILKRLDRYTEPVAIVP